MIEARGLTKRYGPTLPVNDLGYTALVLVADALLLRRRDA
jgi:hypothetical protein